MYLIPSRNDQARDILKCSRNKLMRERERERMRVEGEDPVIGVDVVMEGLGFVNFHARREEGVD